MAGRSGILGRERLFMTDAADDWFQPEANPAATAAISRQPLHKSWPAASLMVSNMSTCVEPEVE